MPYVPAMISKRRVVTPRSHGHLKNSRTLELLTIADQVGPQARDPPGESGPDDGHSGVVVVVATGGGGSGSVRPTVAGSHLDTTRATRPTTTATASSGNKEGRGGLTGSGSTPMSGGEVGAGIGALPERYPIGTGLTGRIHPRSAPRRGRRPRPPPPERQPRRVWRRARSALPG